MKSTHFSSLVFTKGTFTSCPAVFTFWPALFKAAVAAAALASTCTFGNEAAGCALTGRGCDGGLGVVFDGCRKRDMAALAAGVPEREGSGVGAQEWAVA